MECECRSSNEHDDVDNEEQSPWPTTATCQD